MTPFLLAALAALLLAAPAHADWHAANRTPLADTTHVAVLAAPPPPLHDRTPQRVAGICFLGLGVMHCVDAVHAAHRNAQRPVGAATESVWRPLSEGLLSMGGGLAVFAMRF